MPLWPNDKLCLNRRGSRKMILLTSVWKSVHTIPISSFINVTYSEDLLGRDTKMPTVNCLLEQE